MFRISQWRGPIQPGPIQPMTRSESALHESARYHNHIFESPGLNQTLGLWKMKKKMNMIAVYNTWVSESPKRIILGQGVLLSPIFDVCGNHLGHAPWVELQWKCNVDCRHTMCPKLLIFITQGNN